MEQKVSAESDVLFCRASCKRRYCPTRKRADHGHLLPPLLGGRWQFVAICWFISSSMASLARKQTPPSSKSRLKVTAAKLVYV